jgi:membrane protein
VVPAVVAAGRLVNATDASVSPAEAPDLPSWDGVLTETRAALTAVPHALRGFLDDRCIQWAAALAYYTLIGLVPLLVTLFSLMKGLGLHRGLTPFIVRTIGAGSPEVSVQIVQFIDQTNVRAVGVLSFVAALLALVGILGNAEMCLNDIWGRVPGRPVLRKLRALLGTAVLAPFLLLVALAFTTFLRRGTTAWAFLEQLYLGAPVLLVLRLVPYALLWVCFSLLYTHLPNRPVRPASAVVGALITGSCWQLAQWAYVTFVIRIVRYSAFYGALWQLPILLAWLYVAWLIILFGAEVTRAHQARVEAAVTSRDVAGRRSDTGRAE